MWKIVNLLCKRENILKLNRFFYKWAKKTKVEHPWECLLLMAARLDKQCLNCGLLPEHVTLHKPLFHFYPFYIIIGQTEINSRFFFLVDVIRSFWILSFCRNKLLWYVGCLSATNAVLSPQTIMRLIGFKNKQKTSGAIVNHIRRWTLNFKCSFLL